MKRATLAITVGILGLLSSGCYVSFSAWKYDSRGAPTAVSLKGLSLDGLMGKEEIPLELTTGGRYFEGPVLRAGTGKPEGYGASIRGTDQYITNAVPMITEKTELRIEVE